MKYDQLHSFQFCFSEKKHFQKWVYYKFLTVFVCVFVWVRIILWVRWRSGRFLQSRWKRQRGRWGQTALMEHMEMKNTIMNFKGALTCFTILVFILNLSQSLVTESSSNVSFIISDCTELKVVQTGGVFTAIIWPLTFLVLLESSIKVSEGKLVRKILYHDWFKYYKNKTFAVTWWNNILVGKLCCCITGIGLS